MILRKPYAFLIKYFRTIHIVLVILMSYLLYRTTVLFNFFQEYISSHQLITGKDFTGELFNLWMFALPFIIIVVLIILLGVMFYKKKPVVFYVINIIIMIALLVLYNIGYDAISTLETQLLETRTLRLIRDLFTILILFQGLSVVLMFIRATGFDIKKFDFRKDLEELNITEIDNEEFEVDVSVETNVLKRNINNKLRFAKYFYQENKFIIGIVCLIIFSASCFAIYMNLTIYNKIYQENHLFMATDLTMEVSNSYLTKLSYRNKKIVDSNLLIVELNIKANNDNNIKFNTTKAELIVKDQIYYPKNIYKEELFDLGTVYQDSVLSTDFQKILLVYEVPNIKKNVDVLFRYVDNLVLERRGINPKYIKIKLNPYNLDEINTIKNVELTEKVKLNENIFGETSILINSFEIKNEFIINYKFCVNDSECYPSKQYVRPVANTNYDKAILKLTGIFKKDTNIENKKIYDLYTVIRDFGEISYQIDGKTKVQNIGFSKIIPSKAKEYNVYYIEVLKEIEKAEKIELTIRVRDKSYKYKIK